MTHSSEALSALIARIYDCAAGQDDWQGMLGELGALTGAEKANLLTPLEPDAERRLWIAHDLAYDAWLDYGAYYHSRDLLTAIGLTQGIYVAGNAVTDESILNKNALMKSEFYNDFWNPQGIHHAIAAVVCDAHTPNLPLVVVGLYRNRKHPAFTPEDTALVRLLIPHLQRALRLALQFGDNRTRFAASEVLFERLADGIALCARDASLRYANPALERLLAAGDGLRRQENRLVTLNSEETQCLWRAIAACGEAPAPSEQDTLRISRPESTSTYRARVLRLPQLDSLLEFGRRAVALVQITEAKSQLDGTRVDFDALSRTYGLTTAEIRLVAALMQGCPPKRAAQRFNVSENTIRSQIKSVFEKTGVHRQAELILLVSRGKG